MLECAALSLPLPPPLLVVLAFPFEFLRCDGVAHACPAKSEAEFDSEYVVNDCVILNVSPGRSIGIRVHSWREFQILFRSGNAENQKERKESHTSANTSKHRQHQGTCLGEMETGSS